MAFWSSIIGLLAGAGYRQSGIQYGQPGSYNSTAATPVNIDTALQLSAVWACVKLIAESISSLPLNVYKIEPDGKKTLDQNHNLSLLFGNKVNRWQTKQEFFETVLYQLVLLGNSYSLIQRDNSRKIIGLVPLMTQQMETRLDKSGAIVYKYTDGSNVKDYPESDIWHNKLFGNGIVGLSVLGYARNTLAIASGAEESVNKVYATGGKPSGILSIDKILTKQQRDKVKENFNELSEGSQDRLFVLEAGMKYQQVSLSPQDIELLASRRFQIEDIARFFNVPSVLINDTNAATTWGSGIQQIVQGFYKLGLRPYAKRIESSIKANLLDSGEKTKYEVKFDFNDLLMQDLADRIKMYKEAVTGAIMTPNEAREKEGWAKIDGGNDLFMQQQMIPIQQLKELERNKTSGVKDNGESSN